MKVGFFSSSFVLTFKPSLFECFNKLDVFEGKGREVQSSTVGAQQGVGNDISSTDIDSKLVVNDSGRTGAVIFNAPECGIVGLGLIVDVVLIRLPPAAIPLVAIHDDLWSGSAGA